MRTNKGFILLEVLLSLVILGTVFVVSIQALASYVRSTSASHNLTIASALTQQLLARTELNEFKNGMSEGTFDGDFQRFSWKIGKTDISDTESQYEMIVSWVERGQERDLRLMTSKYEYKNKL